MPQAHRSLTKQGKATALFCQVQKTVGQGIKIKDTRLAVLNLNSSAKGGHRDCQLYTINCQLPLKVVFHLDFSIHQALSTHNAISFHMPGHKRRALFALDLPWHLDVTEIAGFDNLHAPQGLLADAQARAAQFFGSKSAYFLVNGSTGGILAGIYACTQAGDKILIARNCHKSVYHAIELLNLRPVYLEPAQGLDFCGSIGDDVAQVLEQHPDIRLVVITSPTYEGVISPVSSFAPLLRRRKIPLLVDQAHGAHLGITRLDGSTYANAITQGADIVVHSLHKTLPGLTQTAIAHLQGGLVDSARFQHALSIFQSSSPSYPLLASIDGCVTYLREHGEKAFAAWQKNLDDFYKTTDRLQHLRLFDTTDNHRHNCHSIAKHDFTKLLILCNGTSMSGTELSLILRKKYNIELELAHSNYALAMTSPCTTAEDLRHLAQALLEIDKTCTPVPPRPIISLPPMPESVMPIAAALNAPGKFAAMRDSIGKIAQTYLWCHPPGIPLLIPGQRVTADVVDAVHALQKQGIIIHSTKPAAPGQLAIADGC